MQQGPQEEPGQPRAGEVSREQVGLGSQVLGAAVSLSVQAWSWREIAGCLTVPRDWARPHPPAARKTPARQDTA